MTHEERLQRLEEAEKRLAAATQNEVRLRIMLRRASSYEAGFEDALAQMAAFVADQRRKARAALPATSNAHIIAKD